MSNQPPAKEKAKVTYGQQNRPTVRKVPVLESFLPSWNPEQVILGRWRPPYSPLPPPPSPSPPPGESRLSAAAAGAAPPLRTGRPESAVGFSLAGNAPRVGGERDRKGRPPEQRGDPAGCAGLSGWAQHVTAQPGSAGGGGARAPGAEIDICLGQESEPVRFRPPQTLHPRQRALPLRFNFACQEPERKR